MEAQSCSRCSMCGISYPYGIWRCMVCGDETDAIKDPPDADWRETVRLALAEERDAEEQLMPAGRDDRLAAAHRELASRWEGSRRTVPPSMEALSEAYTRHRVRRPGCSYAEVIGMLLDDRWPG